MLLDVTLLARWNTNGERRAGFLFLVLRDIFALMRKFCLPGNVGLCVDSPLNLCLALRLQMKRAPSNLEWSLADWCVFQDIKNECSDLKFSLKCLPICVGIQVQRSQTKLTAEGNSGLLYMKENIKAHLKNTWGAGIWDFKPASQQHFCHEALSKSFQCCGKSEHQLVLWPSCFWSAGTRP